MPARDLHCQFPASLQYLTAVRQFVAAFCTDVLETEAYAEQVYQVQLAVSELATNIIVHAYRDMKEGVIDLHLAGANRSMTLDFFDSGKTYARSTTPTLPATDSLAEGGYGSYIIQQCIDRVTYEQDPSGRNHWHFEKQFGGKGGA